MVADTSSNFGIDALVSLYLRHWAAGGGDLLRRLPTVGSPLRLLPSFEQAMHLSVESLGFDPDSNSVTPFGTHQPWKMMVLTHKGERAYRELLRRCPAAVDLVLAYNCTSCAHGLACVEGQMCKSRG